MQYHQFNLAIVNQLTGNFTRLGFLSKSPEPPQTTGGAK